MGRPSGGLTHARSAARDIGKRCSLPAGSGGRAGEIGEPRSRRSGAKARGARREGQGAVDLGPGAGWTLSARTRRRRPCLRETARAQAPPARPQASGAAPVIEERGRSQRHHPGALAMPFIVANDRRRSHKRNHRRKECTGSRSHLIWLTVRSAAAVRAASARQRRARRKQAVSSNGKFDIISSNRLVMLVGIVTLWLERLRGPRVYDLACFGGAQWARVRCNGLTRCALPMTCRHGLQTARRL